MKRILIPFLILMLWHPLLASDEPAAPCLYLTTLFKGENVLIKINGESIYSERVFTEGSTQLGTSIPLRGRPRLFEIVIEVTAPAEKKTTLKQKVDMAKGDYLLLLFDEGRLILMQTEFEPEFY